MDVFVSTALEHFFRHSALVTEHVLGHALLYLVCEGGLSQGVQFSTQLVYLIADIIHLCTQPLVAGPVRVKLPLVLTPLLI